MVKTYIEGESKEDRKLRKAREKALQEIVDIDQELRLIDAHPHNSLVKNQNYILCLKHGTKYSADYVNKLYNMVKRNCTLDYTFVCLTDDTRGLNKDILTIPLPGGIAGWWCKPYMFSKDLPLNGIVLYIDLDVVIASNIDKLFTYQPNNWCTIRDFTRIMRPKWHKYNSSVVRFNTGQLHNVWEDFDRDKINIQRKFHGDQDWLWEATRNKQAMLYPDSWIQSWKWEVRKDKTFKPGGIKGKKVFNKIDNLAKPRIECAICVFHGDPNPEMVQDKWVVDNWK